MPIKRLSAITSKTTNPYRIPWLGIVFGLILTAFLWWGHSSQINLALHWISYAGITVVGLFLLVRTRRRGFTLLALFASVSLVYLFPALLGPACDGMPRAFARDLKCTHRWDCADNECCHAGECLPNSDPKCGGEEPPPGALTISSTINCSMGNNGWCVGGLALYLSASDPQNAQVIISGDVTSSAVPGQVDFACLMGETTCIVPIASEGYGTVNYRVDSASGDSTSGTTSYQLDATTPQIDGSLNGASGTNGWFVSMVNFTASASDAVTGLSSLQMSVDGGTYQSYSPITFGDGIHTITVRAYDGAGNMAETSQTVSVDTVTPQLDISVSGTAGANGWYVSKTEVSANASDGGSGIVALKVSVDGGTWSLYTAPVILSDGVHNLQFRATDEAGLVTEATQTVKVDSITPSLTLSVSGTQGLNGWYTSNVQVAANYSDAGSGVASVEAAVDGVWTPVSAPLFLSDGIHTWQFRVKDQAGHLTQTPVQTVKVDTLAPFIGMTETLSLGETLEYELQDDGSGLAIYRAVIEDDAEKYKKIVWVGELSGSNKEGDILWDGKFKDGTKAGIGKYFITLKISDAAGNESMKSAVVDVSLLSLFQDLPDFIVPQNSEAEPVPVIVAEIMPELAFGGRSGETTGEKTSSHTLAGGEVIVREASAKVSFSQGSQTTNFPIPVSNILWGAAASALVGATLADWKRKREEEQANEPTTYQKAAKAYQRAVDNFRETLVKGGFSQKEAAALKTQAVLNGFIPSAGEMIQEKQERDAELAARLTRTEREENARILAEEEAAKKAAEEKRKAEEAARLNSVNAARWAGLAANYQDRKAGEVAVMPVKEEKSRWDKAWDWAFNNQFELSLGTGVVLGAAGVVAATIISAPALLTVGIIAGAVLATAAIVTAGTVALNAHFGLGLGNNLGSNLLAGIAATIITAGVGLLLANVVAPWVSTTIAATCTNYATACSQIGTIIDKGEEALLAGQLTYYNWIGDQDNAAQTTIELQLEQMDGDAPGNTVAAEMGEQLAKLGPDAVEQIELHGVGIIPLLLKYGDDAVDIIGAYGDEGIALLSLYGDDAVKLIKEYGTPAIDVMMSHGDDVVDLFRKADVAPKDWIEYIPEQYLDGVVPAFNGNAIAIRLEEDVTVYRYWGEGSKEIGNWLTIYPDLTSEQARALLALPNNNPAMNPTQFVIPKDTIILVGEAAEQTTAKWAGSYAIGGGLQIYAPDTSVLIKQP